MGEVDAAAARVRAAERADAVVCARADAERAAAVAWGRAERAKLAVARSKHDRLARKASLSATVAREVRGAAARARARADRDAEAVVMALEVHAREACSVASSLSLDGQALEVCALEVLALEAVARLRTDAAAVLQ